MGKKLIIKGADFSANGIEDTEGGLGTLRWYGWLGGDNISHMMMISRNTGKVLLTNNNPTTGRNALSGKRSICIVNVARLVGKTLSLVYSKNKSSTYDYACFASDINFNQLNNDLRTSLTNTDENLETTAITYMNDYTWNNVDSGDVIITDLCDPLEKVVPVGAKYLVFDHCQESTSGFNGSITVEDESNQ